jgi:cysteine-rich repeat protein
LLYWTRMARNVYRVLFVAAALVVPAELCAVPDASASSSANGTESAGQHRSAVGSRLAERLRQPMPAEGLSVAVALLRDDLPRRGKSRRGAIAARQQRVLDSLPSQGVRLRRRYRSLSGFAVQVANSAALDALLRHPETALVYLDGTVHATLRQGNALIGANTVQASGYTGAGIKVAVLDTGIDSDHPDLVGDLAAQHCFCNGCCAGGADESSSAEDDDGHGTAVSGIITSDGVRASVGVAPDAEIIAVRVLGASGGSFSSIAAALDWLLVQSMVPGDPVEGLRVVNLSLSDAGEHNNPAVLPCSGTNTANAIQLLDQNGIAVVASSGNGGYDNGIGFPACVAEAISVGGVYDAAFSSVSWCGTTCQTNLCTDTSIVADDFVCHTNSDEILDVLAPNWRTATSARGGGTTDFGGTSASSPYVAGEAALLFEAKPTLTPSEIRTLLETHGPLVTNPDNGLSWVRSDVAGAIASVAAPACGNSIVEPGEDCDDGNTVGGDCCSASCVLEPDGAVCDDDLFCTKGETCSAGMCSGEDVCAHGFSCDEAAKLCVGAPPVFEEHTESALRSRATSLTLSIPGGTNEGDLLIGIIALDGSHADSLAPPAGEGWRELQLDAGGSTPTLGVWWKLAEASESSHEWSWSGGEEAYGALLRFTGHDAATPIRNSAARGGGSSRNPTAPAVAPTSLNTLILRIGGFDDDDVRVGDAGVAGHVTILMEESSSGSGTCSLGVASEIAGIGAVSAADFTLTSSEQWRTVTLSLPPPISRQICGDGIPEGAEECDAGSANGNTLCGCTADCTIPVLGTSCEDGVFCTVGDACNGIGGCVAGSASDASCTNGLFCDGAETCHATNDCQPGIPPAIDDGVACTDDSCDETGNVIVHAPNHLSCTNGLFCDGTEICDRNLGCRQGEAPEALVFEDFEGYPVQSDSSGTMISELGETYLRVTTDLGDVVATAIAMSNGIAGVAEEAGNRYWTLDATSRGEFVVRGDIPADPATEFSRDGPMAVYFAAPRNLLADPPMLLCADVRDVSTARSTEVRFLLGDADGNLVATSESRLLSDAFTPIEFPIDDSFGEILGGATEVDFERIQLVGFEMSASSGLEADFAFDIDNVRLIPEPSSDVGRWVAMAVIATLAHRGRAPSRRQRLRP